MLIEAGRWVEEFWARQHSRAWYLLQVGLLDPYGHCFDAMGRPSTDVAGTAADQLASCRRIPAQSAPSSTMLGSGSLRTAVCTSTSFDAGST